ncbi:hypothetical protein [Microcystis aeruginosa]|uniref:hypothetical protein n=1 Tax=Microcystis aeruginosa TaxID=1126 RepID=UPI00046892BA|nr:hypothetical protein [Microcystis aeruginosa]MDB9397857.1 hypothetical protein [Microcystis aeruginosa CS-573]
MFSYLKSFLVSHASKLILSLLVGVPVITTVSIIISNQIAKKEPIDLQPEEVVRRLQEDYPGWQDKLFACPCTEDEIIQQRIINAKSYPLAPAGLGELAVEEFENNHPGAKGFYRSVAPEEYRPEGRKDLYPLRPGQQCTYDENGRLITHGPAAGTPDAYGSNATDSYFFTSIGKGKVSGLHTTWDVDTYKKLGWREYHKIWKPNNGNSCLFNPSPENVRSLDKQIAKAEFGIPRLLVEGVLVTNIRLFREDIKALLDGSRRELYEVIYESKSKDNVKREWRRWVQCSKNNPWIAYSLNDYDNLKESQNSLIMILNLSPGNFPSYVGDYRLYWAICHNEWNVSQSFMEFEYKKYGYSPQLEFNARPISETEFLEALYGDRSL